MAESLQQSKSQKGPENSCETGKRPKAADTALEPARNGHRTLEKYQTESAASRREGKKVVEDRGSNSSYRSSREGHEHGQGCTLVRKYHIV